MNAELDRLLSKATTREDWEEIWSIEKSRYDRFEANLGRNFYVGDNVSFEVKTGRSRGYYKGTITKMTTVRANVTTTRGLDWGIPFSWLKKE